MVCQQTQNKQYRVSIAGVLDKCAATLETETYRVDCDGPKQLLLGLEQITLVHGIPRAFAGMTKELCLHQDIVCLEREKKKKKSKIVKLK